MAAVVVVILLCNDHHMIIAVVAVGHPQIGYFFLTSLPSEVWNEQEGERERKCGKRESEMFAQYTITIL